MERRLLNKKKILLRIFTMAAYRKLLGFISDVYLADYDLKLLLARKFSNLYQCLWELALEEDGGRVRKLYEEKRRDPNWREPVIISDRALEAELYFLRQEDSAANGRRLERILLVDDIIIHGRTVSALHERIVKQFQDMGRTVPQIDIWAYAENKGQILDKDCLKERRVYMPCGESEWRDISNRIVDCFHALSEPYTSYVPNLVFSLKSPEGQKLLQAAKSNTSWFQMEGPRAATEGTKAYAWIAPKRYGNTLFESVRLYVNEELDKCVFVPMVSLLPLEENGLKNYEEELKPLIRKEYWLCMRSAGGDLEYRTIIYAISALWGKLFLESQGIHKAPVALDKESLNFSRLILNIEELEKMSESQLETCMRQLEKGAALVDETAVWKLAPDFEKLKTCVPDSAAGGTIDGIEAFLFGNGELDEKQWKESNGSLADSKRLAGYPVVFLYKALVGEGVERRTFFVRLLQAIDSGKGSIVAKSFIVNGNRYFVSLLHGGEQNYRYFEKKYFLPLYGMLWIESECEETKRWDRAGEMKQRFLKCLQEAGMCALKDEREYERLKELNVSKAYKKVLLADLGYYADYEALGTVVGLAEKINERGCHGNK